MFPFIALYTFSFASCKDFADVVKPNNLELLTDEYLLPSKCLVFY